jgi:hypothetical protein
MERKEVAHQPANASPKISSGDHRPARASRTDVFVEGAERLDSVNVGDNDTISATIVCAVPQAGQRTVRPRWFSLTRSCFLQWHVRFMVRL